MGKFSIVVLILLSPYLCFKYSDDFHPKVYLSEIWRKYNERNSKENHGKKPGPVYEECNTCLRTSCSPSVKGPSEIEFHSDIDCVKLYSLFGTFHTNENELMDILTSRTEIQRKRIILDFKDRYKIHLTDKIIENLTDNHFTKLMFSLALSLPEFYAEQFAEAFSNLKQGQEKGLDTVRAQKTILEMFATLPNCLLKKVIFVYDSTPDIPKFISELKLSLVGFPVKDVVDVYVDLANRPSKSVVAVTDWVLAWKEAKKLHKAVKTHHWGNARQYFREIYTTQSIRQLRETIIIYEKMRKNDPGFTNILQDINRVHEKATVIYETLTKIAVDEISYNAALLKSMLDVGDYDRFLYMIRARSGIDLKDINDAYYKANGENLSDTFLKSYGTTRNVYIAVRKLVLG